jgi:DNA-binding transcriptional MerR regulator
MSPPPIPESGQGWAIAEVARRVGVTTSTLRAWERRYGLAPSGRTDGGHRRYTSVDIGVLQRLQQLITTGVPTATAAALARQPPSTGSRVDGNGHGPMERARRELADAVWSMDPLRATAIADTILTRHGTVAGWQEVFTPVLRSLGAHWEDAGLGVEREHVGTAAVHTALVRQWVRHRLRATRTRVLGAAAPDEQHSLPLHALAAALAERDIGMFVLEAAPPVALRSAVRGIEPAAVVLWVLQEQAADSVLLSALVPLVPAVFAAGPGWPDALPPGVAALRDLPGAVDAVTELATANH